MNNITKIDPEKFLENSKADLFQIIVVIADGPQIYAGGSFYSMEHGGFQHGTVYERKDLVKAYWDAFRFANSDLRVDPYGKTVVEGVLHIIEIPKFGE